MNFKGTLVGEVLVFREQQDITDDGGALGGFEDVLEAAGGLARLDVEEVSGILGYTRRS